MRTPWRSSMVLASLALLALNNLRAQSAAPAFDFPAASQQAAPGAPSVGSPGSGTASTTQQHVAPLARKAPASASPGEGAAPPSDSAALRLIVGRSMFLHSVDKLRRVYVSNPSVLDALTASQYQVVITAKTAGSSSVVMWSADGQSTMYTVFADADVSGLIESLHQALPGDDLAVQVQEGRIRLSGVVSSDAASEEAARLAATYSREVVNALVVDPRHLPQVQLQVRIAEIDRSKLTEFGINFFSLGKNTGAATTGQFNAPSFKNENGSSTAVVSDFLNLFYFNFDHGLGTTIRDLQTKGVLQILAEPNLTTIHGKPARFLAGGQFPYPIVQPGGAGTVPTVTVQFQPYGVKLEFTPFVNSDGTIRLKVAPEVSALDYTNQVVIAGYVLPALSTRKAETEVELKDGQSFGISGILDNRTTDNLSKIPGIGDIPVLGQLFRSKNLNRSTMELVVLVTPKLVDPLSAADVSAPKTPSMAVPFLEQQKFDRNLPKN